MNKLEKLWIVVTTMWAIGLFAVAIGHIHASYTSHNNYHLFSSIFYIVCSFILGYVLRFQYRNLKSDS